MSLITSEDCVAIFGSGGMVGSAISRALNSSGYANQLLPSRSELDLLDHVAVCKWFSISTFCSCARSSKSWWHSCQRNLSCRFCWRI